MTNSLSIQRSILLLTKTATAQNEVALSYHRVRGLCFLAVNSAATKACLDVVFVVCPSLPPCFCSVSLFTTLLLHISTHNKVIFYIYRYNNSANVIMCLCTCTIDIA